MQRIHTFTLNLLLKISGTICALYGIISLVYRIGFGLFFIAAGVICYSAAILRQRYQNRPMGKSLKVLSGVAKGMIIILSLTFIVVQGLILSAAFAKQKTNPDYLLILGAGLWGNQPSTILLDRLNTSLELIKSLPPQTKILVSGGQGPGETISEAECIKRYLTARGIAKNRIVKEERSTSTLENMQFSYKIIAADIPPQTAKVTIVTNTFHMFRAKMLAKRTGFIQIYTWPAPTRFSLIPAYFTREFLAILASLF